MAGNTFPKGGIHPEEHKELTEHLSIEEMPAPAQVVLPLSMHFGAPAKPVVKKKQEVAEGEVIATVEKALGATIHSSVTGTVRAIESRPHPTMVRCDAVIIDRDPSAAPRRYEPEDWEKLTREQLLARVKDAGIVGLGGAGFPTHVKLSPPPTAKVDTLVLNGAECEPYLTTDHRLMLEHPEKVVEGTKVLLKILGIKKAVIGIELNKADAINVMTKAAQKASKEIAVQGMQVKYPQGSEKQLIYSLTHRSVPGGGLPFDVGVIVQNISTTLAVFEAASMQKPLYEKVVTFSGRALNRQANLKVKVGTVLSDVVDYLGGTQDLLKIVSGGPMMGFAISSMEVPVTKTTSGVLFLNSKETSIDPHGPCIHCGWCMQACPMGLSPKEVGIYVEAGKGHLTEKFGVFDCFECGCCAYVCPAKRPLVQFARLAKIAIKKHG
ncbi:electron transport complex subunit RsxC [Desulfomonile tiedjei]|uniref:Ion-translocating oxidoreductase complex subunit C n=1 Tax=Desulfomonile tiedjei (strain ATCC 49306 / DSM 6799 / DCB-1) TaxID=706587 RepID=I4C7N0_DESTA|nr:electron transport complex subunit RsxC [Desulfomonile tiedjei]AFM25571.1 electron transport complex, RnfABCDGE type, C subunit [Desulfomonile tiedjei DSM 6799]